MIKKPLFLVKVEGESCWPYLVPGKTYLATNILKPKEKDFVVFRDPKDSSQILVKRVEKIINDKLYVKGTVSWSSKIEPVNKKLILGKLCQVK